jgi:glycosyltransferase involved in cell wall biosynthesis
MARVVTLCTERPLSLNNMAHIRWYKVAEALTRLGHVVDIAANAPGARRWWPQRTEELAHKLRLVPFRRVRWSEYDVVKIANQSGFELLERLGGAGHHHIISRLGTVVPGEDTEGFYFHGELRRRMYELQGRISRGSRCIAVSNEAARTLWTQQFGTLPPVLLVPGGVDRDIPDPDRDPYPPGGARRCLFAGNFSYLNYAPQANEVLCRKLNRLGERLRRHEVTLFAIGPGDTELLDPRYVIHLGVVPYERTWSYLQFAHVGIEAVKGQGSLHNTESSKVYHYLRAGLPTVIETGLPNAELVRDAGLGFVVESDDLDAFSAKVVEAAETTWDRQRAVEYVLDRHTWDHRALVYHRWLTNEAG